MSGGRTVGERTLALHVTLAIAAILVLAPCLYIVAAGFRTQISLMMGAITFTPVLTNFTDVLSSQTSDFLLNFKNSAIVALITTALCLIIATLAAWSLRQVHWRAWIVRGFLLWALVFHLIPPVTLAGAWFTMFGAVGLDNTLTALVLAHTALNLPVALWLMSVFLAEVPPELEEAARIDGASTPAYLVRILVPLVAPGLAATAVLVFIFSWNEFAVALNLTVVSTATVPVAIAKYAQEYEIQYGQMAASAALSIVPALVLLLIGQRYIVRGLTAGAVK